MTILKLSRAVPHAPRASTQPPCPEAGALPILPYLVTKYAVVYWYDTPTYLPLVTKVYSSLGLEEALLEEALLEPSLGKAGAHLG